MEQPENKDYVWNSLAPYGYDATWAIALALDKAVSVLKTKRYCSFPVVVVVIYFDDQCKLFRSLTSIENGVLHTNRQPNPHYFTGDFRAKFLSTQCKFRQTRVALNAHSQCLTQSNFQNGVTNIRVVDEVR